MYEHVNAVLSHVCMHVYLSFALGSCCQYTPAMAKRANAHMHACLAQQVADLLVVNLKIRRTHKELFPLLRKVHLRKGMLGLMYSTKTSSYHRL